MYGNVTLICYFVLLPYIRDFNIIIFNNLTLNSFSFLMICFIPPAVVYMFHYKRNKKIAIFIFFSSFFRQTKKFTRINET